MRIALMPHMKLKFFLILAMALGLLATAEKASANLIIYIDQTGANQPVNVEAPRAWNFGVTSVGAAYFSVNGITFDSALFNAKDHKGTTAPLVFTLYSGLGGNVAGNTVLATLSVPASQFNQQYSGGMGSLFTFAPQLLTTGYYSVTLTTTAPNKSTEDYFLKQGKLTLLDANKQALDSSFWLQDQGVGNATAIFNGSGSLYNDVPSTLAPEVNPAWAMAILGAASLGRMFVRRSRKSAPAAA